MNQPHAHFAREFKRQESRIQEPESRSRPLETFAMCLSRWSTFLRVSSDLKAPSREMSREGFDAGKEGAHFPARPFSASPRLRGESAPHIPGTSNDRLPVLRMSREELPARNSYTPGSNHGAWVLTSQ